MVKRFVKFSPWILTIVKKRALTFFSGFAFALLCFIVLNTAMEPVSTSKYCGSNCHEMHGSLRTWEHSVHGGGAKGLKAECIDCHLPEKDRYFSHVITKAYDGGKDVFMHYIGRIFGVEYKPEKTRLKVLDRMKNEKCMRCHAGLLDKPGNELIREVHMEALNASGNTEQTRCVECHEDAGHTRQSNSPATSEDKKTD